ncbi:hypothetical protein [Pseudomonas azerbaijanoccidentalis]
MHFTINTDDTRYKAALDLDDLGMQIEYIFNKALDVYVRVKAGKRLAELGGKSSLTEDIRRRQSEPDQ